MTRRLLALALAGAAAVAGVTVLGGAAAPGDRPPAAAPVPAPVTSPGADALTRGDLLPTSPPEHLEIPALRVSVPVTGLGLSPDGTMEVPDDARTVGWYTRAPTPGSLGPAILAGHVDYRGADGTFAHLADLRPADRIRVTRQDGRTAVFAVTAVDQYPKDRFPTDAVYGPADHAGLRLITCGGDFDRRSGHYEDNVVVFAELITT
ncbi:class F sortase [Actinoplanes sp. GCM10030250]|uniref:class F sortase n=1 Tax=Actinoplanes sp. GCM10030250 TaxID=3273376 RepID=UPI0036161666